MKRWLLLAVCVYVCMNGVMCTLLAPGTVGRYFIGIPHFSVYPSQVNALEIRTAKLRKSFHFLEAVLFIFITFQYLWRQPP
jgi:hypothetical protein